MTDIELFSPNTGIFTYIVSILKIVFAISVGGIVITYLKDVQNFLLGSFIKIGDLLFKIILRILDIFYILLKIWFFIFKNVIIFLKFVFFYIMLIIFFHFQVNEKEYVNVNLINKEELK